MAAESHITFVLPREMIISSKVRVPIIEISHPNATAIETTEVFSSSGSVSPNKDQEIGPSPRLNAAKIRVIQVGDIQKQMSSYSGSLSRKLKNQPGTDETEDEGKFQLVLLFSFRGTLFDGSLFDALCPVEFVMRLFFQIHLIAFFITSMNLTFVSEISNLD